MYIPVGYLLTVVLIHIVDDILCSPAAFALPKVDEKLLFRSKRDVISAAEDARSLLKGFLRLSADIPLTPKRRSNFGSQPVGYKVIDRTEYAVNKKILDEVFESDMVLTVPQLKDIIEHYQQRKARRTRTKRKAIVGRRFRWPDNTVPYILNGTDARWQSLIRNGMQKWEEETCIHFKQRTDEKDYVFFFKGAGCYSSVGRIGGRQYASIGFGCESSGIIAHEIGHAIGFWHEQSRPDRDKYININEDHIFKGTKGNFEKRDDIEDLGTPYDFGSVMHYGPQAFSDDYKYVTIETKDHRFQHTIGQRKDLSFIDVKEANELYCSEICQKKLACTHGGYTNPKDCRRCKCPPGLAGKLCKSLPKSHAGCGGELYATSQWQTLQSDIVGDCYWRITASNGRVHLSVLDASYKCESSCADDYLEIKYSKDMQQTGFRQCCNAAPGEIISETDEVIIISSATTAPSSFSLRYILDSPDIALPKAPPARWNGGGGLTSLIGAENGIDNTFEQFILKELPRTFRSFGRSSHSDPFHLINNFLKSFLKP
ncbi:hypothetical protein AB6A40_002330 [Gnathostoma spinigerum]|uniref:Metalloendopeptidase n=1 Tax=Gnathostoma spinigerum TaxID=75299 RepID=A0ABD6E7M3_9BILA